MPAGPVRPPIDPGGITEIGIERFGAFGGPRYTAILYKDGTVRYVKDLREKGEVEYTGKVGPVNFAWLAAYLRESRYADLENAYARGGMDASSVYTTVVENGKRKTVRDYGGAGPVKLWGIEQMIEKALYGVEWDNYPGEPPDDARSDTRAT